MTLPPVSSVTHTLPDELKALEKMGVRLASQAELLTKDKNGLREAQAALNSLNVMLRGIVGKLPTESESTAAVQNFCPGH